MTTELKPWQQSGNHDNRWLNIMTLMQVLSLCLMSCAHYFSTPKGGVCPSIHLAVSLSGPEGHSLGQEEVQELKKKKLWRNTKDYDMNMRSKGKFPVWDRWNWALCISTGRLLWVVPLMVLHKLILCCHSKRLSVNTGSHHGDATTIKAVRSPISPWRQQQWLFCNSSLLIKRSPPFTQSWAPMLSRCVFQCLSNTSRAASTLSLHTNGTTGSLDLYV